MSDPKLHIVRPFGLIGGKYEVDDAGVRKYWLAWAIAALFVGLLMFRGPLGLPLWLLGVAAVASLGAAFALCADVARNGRKI